MREKNIKRVFMCCLTALAANTYAQNFNWVSSTEGNTWKQSKVKLQSSAGQTPAFRYQRNGRRHHIQSMGNHLQRTVLGCLEHAHP